MRRLKNHSVHAKKELVEEVLIEYMDNLLGMGYTEEWRTKVLRSTFLGYERVMQKVDRGETQRNRDGKSTRTLRRWKVLMGQSTWFKTAKRPHEDELPLKM